MSVDRFFVEKAIDWEKIPSLAVLEKVHSRYIDGGLSIKEGQLSFRATAGKAAKRFKYQPSEYLPHKTSDLSEVRQMYCRCGFETKLILQDPFGHSWPSAVCPIGFPFTFPRIYPELRRYNGWICRVHVEIALTDTKKIVSVPHIEPDPKYHAAAHIIDTYIGKNVVRGEIAVEILSQLVDSV